MGRPPRTLHLGGKRRFLAVELGVRRTQVAWVGIDGTPLLPIQSFPTPESVSDWRTKLAEMRLTFDGHADRMLLSLPGVFDAERGELICSPNLPWSEGRQLLEAAADAGGAPVIAVQEIQALALGHRASGRAADSFVLVDFGDGVGGAVMTGGELLHSPLPLCGELGHTGVHGNRRRCACGAVGCLETLVSRQGLLQSFQAASGSKAASWDDLRERVQRHGAEAWLLPSLDAAGSVLAGAINLLGIQSLVLTGDLPGLHPDIGRILTERAVQHSLIGRFGKLDGEVAPRRRIQGLITAAEDYLLQPEA